MNPRTEINVLVLTEMWLDSTHLNAKYNIPGYHLKCKDTIDNTRGGMYTTIKLETSDTDTDTVYRGVSLQIKLSCYCCCYTVFIVWRTPLQRWTQSLKPS